MYSEGDLQREANSLVDSYLKVGLQSDPNWMTQAILNRHPLPDDFEGEHREFSDICRFNHVRAAVRKAVNRYKVENGPQEDKQLVLPGFDHLQRGYLVTRDKQQVLVPVDLLTDEEIEGKALEYERMAEGCRAHAKELRQYMRERRVSAA